MTKKYVQKYKALWYEECCYQNRIEPEKKNVTGINCIYHLNIILVNSITKTLYKIIFKGQ